MNNMHSCAKSNIFSSSPASLPPPGLYFFCWPHTHTTSFSFLSLDPWSLDIFFFSFFLCPFGEGWGGGVSWGFVLKAVEERWWESNTEREREAVLFHHTRSLCGCQPSVAALGMVCMCWASGGAGHTSGKEWGGRWWAWNNEVKS